MKKETFKSYNKHWVASDIHLSHLNIMQYCPDTRGKCVDVHHMNEMIIERWNSVVGIHDHTFILGDVAMGQIVLAPPLIRRLNGTKTLVRGNHDKTLVKLPEFNSLFIDAHDYLEIIVASTMVCMSHFPMASWNGMSKGSIFLHGHCHGAPTGVLGWIHDVGIDTNDLKPYNLEELVHWIKLNKASRTHDHHGSTIL